MGSCQSSETSENHQEHDLISAEERVCSNGGSILSSLCSRQGKKGPNQDSVVLCQDYGEEEGMFYGVFDGHGMHGHLVSTLVRDCLPFLVLRHWNALHSPYSNQSDAIENSNGDSVSQRVFAEWKEAFLRAFKEMDKELKLHKTLNCICSGTTAVTIIKQGKDLIIANLGDSRAILGTIDDDGYLTIVQLTTDLKPNLPQEAERIKKSHGRVFALRDEPNIHRVWLPHDDFPGLAMARAFGDFKLKNYGVIAVPQLSHHRLSTRDQFLLLATDGVWDVLSNRQVASIAWSAESEEAGAKAVVDAAVRAWRKKFPCSKIDDCSAVCVFLQERKQGLMVEKS